MKGMLQFSWNSWRKKLKAYNRINVVKYWTNANYHCFCFQDIYTVYCSNIGLNRSFWIYSQINCFINFTLYSYLLELLNTLHHIYITYEYIVRFWTSMYKSYRTSRNYLQTSSAMKSIYWVGRRDSCTCSFLVNGSKT